MLASLGAETETETSIEHSSTHSSGVTSSVESRALELLGSGVSSEATAAALGVTESRISQLLSDEEFSKQVITLRYKKLSQHNERDKKYDNLEDKLVEKLERSLPLMIKPELILKAIQTINSAKRRGVDSPSHMGENQTVVKLTLPTAIVNKFTVNTNNQVVKTGDQDLVTIQSGTLLDHVKDEETGSDESIE